MDVSAMAERISSAASAPPVAEAPATPSVETPAAAPAVEQQSTPPPGAPTEPELQFDDEPEPLNFDEEDTPAVAAAPELPKPDAITDDKGIKDLQALLNAGGLPKQLENALMATNRGRNLLSLYKSERVLKELPNIDPATGRNTGGLGYMPTPEQIKEFHQGHAELQSSIQEFQINPQSWAVNWFGPDQQGAFRPGVEQVLSSIPQVLDRAYNLAVSQNNEAMQKQAVELYRTTFSPMLESYISGFYERARQIADPATRERLIDAARLIENDMFGKTRPVEQLAPPGPMDALAEREQALAEREQRLNAWQQKNQTEAQKATENEIFSTIEQSLTRDCEKALASIKAGKTERAFRALVNDFKTEVREAVRKDQVGWRDFNFALSSARTNRGADARTAPVQTYQQIARRVINSRYRSILQEEANDATRQNGAAHSTAAKAAAQTAPTANGGQPPPQSVVAQPKVERKPGEGQTDYNLRRIRSALGAPN